MREGLGFDFPVRIKSQEKPKLRTMAQVIFLREHKLKIWLFYDALSLPAAHSDILLNEMPSTVFLRVLHSSLSGSSLVRGLVGSSSGLVCV